MLTPGETPAAIATAPASVPRVGGFISYSHKEPEYLMELQEALVPYTGSGAFGDVWDDTRIPAGSEWREEIDSALGQARVAVLLVSRHFLASDFIRWHELPYLLEASQRKNVKVLWVAVSASGYKETGLKELQALNDPRNPLDSLSK